MQEMYISHSSGALVRAAGLSAQSAAGGEGRGVDTVIVSLKY